VDEYGQYHAATPTGSEAGSDRPVPQRMDTPQQGSGQAPPSTQQPAQTPQDQKQQQQQPGSGSNPFMDELLRRRMMGGGAPAAPGGAPVDNLGTLGDEGLVNEALGAKSGPSNTQLAAGSVASGIGDALSQLAKGFENRPSWHMQASAIPDPNSFHNQANDFYNHYKQMGY
jgi:hypothetical protein